MFETLAISLGAFWRAWRGGLLENTPSGIKTPIGALIVLFAAWVGVANMSTDMSLIVFMIVIFSAIIAIINELLAVSLFIPKEIGWNSKLMALRYSLPAIAVCIPGWLGFYAIQFYGVHYIGMCVIAGLVYPLFTKHIEKVESSKTRYWLVRAIEGYNGAAVIGGLALL